jgi:hypothetical protein
MGEMSGG